MTHKSLGNCGERKVCMNQAFPFKEHDPPKEEGKSVCFLDHFPIVIEQSEQHSYITQQHPNKSCRQLTPPQHKIQKYALIYTIIISFSLPSIPLEMFTLTSRVFITGKRMAIGAPVSMCMWRRNAAVTPLLGTAASR